MSQTRRLAAILAADVAGYSRLMGADEEGALERLKALRRDLVDSKVVEHHGGVPGARPGTKTTGDGLRVGFFGPSMRCFRCRLVRQRRCKIQLSGDRSQAPVVRP